MNAPVRGVRRQPLPARKRERTEPTVLRPDKEIEKVDVQEQAQAYVDVMAETSPNKLGYWVECSLEAYKGLRVLFRTSNRTRARMSRPQYQEPYELRAKRRRIARLRTDQITEFTEDRDREIENLSDEIISEANAYEQKVQLEQCEWLSQFVLDFEPWPFQQRMPDPDEPSTYHILYTDFEDLYGWIINVGYVRALEASVKNSLRD